MATVIVGGPIDHIAAAGGPRPQALQSRDEFAFPSSCCSFWHRRPLRAGGVLPPPEHPSGAAPYAGTGPHHRRALEAHAAARAGGRRTAHPRPRARDPVQLARAGPDRAELHGPVRGLRRARLRGRFPAAQHRSRWSRPIRAWPSSCVTTSTAGCGAGPRHRGDAFAVAAGMPTAGFDVVFLDPPFAEDWLGPALEHAARLSRPGGLVYVETDRALTGPQAPVPASGTGAPGPCRCRAFPPAGASRLSLHGGTSDIGVPRAPQIVAGPAMASSLRCRETVGQAASKRRI